MTIRVKIVSIPVDDQDHALSFYRDKLGFVVQHDEDMGGGARWLTLASPDDLYGTQILLEPNGAYPAMKALKDSLRKDGLPYTQFSSDELTADVERLTAAGVTFTTDIIDTPTVRYAIFDDTCGNTIMLAQTLSG